MIHLNTAMNHHRPSALPRLAPGRPFPPYTFIPGWHPHPTHHPEGHSYGVEPAEIDPPDPAAWAGCGMYLHGIDLFNHGYYWEAHEAWEELWQADGRIGPVSDFLKALIKLAAAGVKVREGLPQGARAHALNALPLFEKLKHRQAAETARFMGLDLGALSAFARAVAHDPPPGPPSASPAVPVFDFLLLPSE